MLNNTSSIVLLLLAHALSRWHHLWLTPWVTNILLLLPLLRLTDLLNILLLRSFLHMCLLCVLLNIGLRRWRLLKVQVDRQIGDGFHLVVQAWVVRLSIWPVNRLACLEIGLLKCEWGHAVIVRLRLDACLVALLVLLFIREFGGDLRVVLIVNFWTSVKVMVTQRAWIKVVLILLLLVLFYLPVCMLSHQENVPLFNHLANEEPAKDLLWADIEGLLTTVSLQSNELDAVILRHNVLLNEFILGATAKLDEAELKIDLILNVLF